MSAQLTTAPNPNDDELQLCQKALAAVELARSHRDYEEACKACRHLMNLADDLYNATMDDWENAGLSDALEMSRSWDNERAGSMRKEMA